MRALTIFSAMFVALQLLSLCSFVYSAVDCMKNPFHRLCRGVWAAENNPTAFNFGKRSEPPRKAACRGLPDGWPEHPMGGQSGNWLPSRDRYQKVPLGYQPMSEFD